MRTKDFVERVFRASRYRLSEDALSYWQAVGLMPCRSLGQGVAVDYQELDARRGIALGILKCRGFSTQELRMLFGMKGMGRMGEDFVDKLRSIREQMESINRRVKVLNESYDDAVLGLGSDNIARHFAEFKASEAKTPRERLMAARRKHVAQAKLDGRAPVPWDEWAQVFADASAEGAALVLASERELDASSPEGREAARIHAARERKRGQGAN